MSGIKGLTEKGGDSIHRAGGVMAAALPGATVFPAAGGQPGTIDRREKGAVGHAAEVFSACNRREE